MEALVCLQKHAPRPLSFYPVLEKDGVPIGCLPNSLDYRSRHDNQTNGVEYEKLNKWALICQGTFQCLRTDGYTSNFSPEEGVDHMAEREDSTEVSLQEKGIACIIAIILKQIEKSV